MVSLTFILCWHFILIFFLFLCSPVEMTESLILSNLELTDERVEGVLSGKTKASQLHLDQNHITKIPSSVGQFSNLTMLVADHNRLTALPIELTNLKKLAYLGISHNQLVAIPKWIGQLKSLKHLSVNDNPDIKELPNELSMLSVLSSIFTQNTGLEPALQVSIFCDLKETQAFFSANLTSLLSPKMPHAEATSKRGFSLKSNPNDIAENIRERRQNTVSAVGMADWTIEEVCSKLEAAGALSSEIETIRSERVDGQTLMELTSENLKDDLGMTLKVRALVQKWIKEAKGDYTI